MRSTTIGPSAPRLSLRHLDAGLRVLAAVLAVALVAIATFIPQTQNDFWVQAAVGRMIVQTGEIPRTLVFPFTWASDNFFNVHEWLPSVVFYGLLEWLGFDGLVFALGALGLLLFASCALLAWRECRSPAVTLLLSGMAMAVANYRHYLRPELFALLFLVLTLYLLASSRAGGRRWPLLGCLPVAVVWANSHGSFILGPIMAGAFALGEGIEAARGPGATDLRSRLKAAATAGAPYAMTALGMALVSLVNPLGWKLYHFVFELSGSDVFKAGIGEWMPTFSDMFMEMRGFWIYIGGMLITLIVMLVNSRKLRATEIVLVLAVLPLTLTRVRYPVLFGFVALLVCARLIGPLGLTAVRERMALATSAAISALGIAAVLIHGNAYGAFPYYSPSTNFTKPMLDQLADERLKGNVFNSYELGAELIYRAYPRLRPSIDSRADSYGDAYFVMHFNLMFNEPELKAFLADFDVRYMLVNWRDFTHLKKLTGLRNAWRMKFADHKAVLLERIPKDADGR